MFFLTHFFLATRTFFLLQEKTLRQEKISWGKKKTKQKKTILLLNQ